ncbi:MAG: M81 family metallopeptidase [Clostridiales bacterium]|nr:M81 family metallopeptidase [Clostridiales bacterium]
MKIIVGKIGHEANTFADGCADFAKWSSNGYHADAALLKHFTEVNKLDYLSGMISVARAAGAEVIPTVALLNAAPLIAKDAYEYVLGDLLDRIRANCRDVDGICLALHGAGCAEGVDDMEADILQKVREIVGDDMPITITLDLHANMSDDMVRLANGIFPLKQYPHIDRIEAATLAMESLIAMIEKRKNLYMRLIKMPLLISPATGNTMTMPMKSFMEYVKGYVADTGILDASLLHGFPYADRSIAGASILTVSDKCQEEADNAAEELAQSVWNRREELLPHVISAKQGVDLALQDLEGTASGYVVLADSSDNPGGGAPGDNTLLLKELLDRDIPGSIMGYIADGETTALAHAAGVGGRISGMLGGKTSSLSGQPIPFKDAYVCALSDGNVVYNTNVVSGKGCYGKSARIRIGNVEVVVAEKLTQQTFDNTPFLMVGADIDHYRIVSVKSSNHFRAWFAGRAKSIYVVSTPGVHTADLASLPYKQISRPIYPLDLDIVWNVPRKD